MLGTADKQHAETFFHQISRDHISSCVHFPLIFFDSFFESRASGITKIVFKIEDNWIENNAFVEGYVGLFRGEVTAENRTYTSISEVIDLGLLNPDQAVSFNPNPGNSQSVAVAMPFAQTTKFISNRKSMSFPFSYAVVVMRYRNGQCKVHVASLFNDNHEIRKNISIRRDE